MGREDGLADQAALLARRFVPARRRRVRRAALAAFVLSLAACALLTTSTIAGERLLSLPLPPLEETTP